MGDPHNPLPPWNTHVAIHHLPFGILVNRLIRDHYGTQNCQVEHD